MTVPTLVVPPLLVDDRIVKAFTIDGLSMRGPAWVLEVAPLVNESPAARGGDVIIDGIPGQVPYLRHVDETGYTLELVVNGFWKPDGSAWSNPEIGWETNVLALRAVCDPKQTGDGTRAADALMPSGAHRTGKLTPEGMRDPQMAGFVGVYKFHCSLPAGVLT